MKCPLKTIKETTYRFDKTETVTTTFGECDLRLCMAYNASKGECRMMIGNREKEKNT